MRRVGSRYLRTATFSTRNRCLPVYEETSRRPALIETNGHRAKKEEKSPIGRRDNAENAI